MRELITNFYEYDSWATEKLLKTLEQLTPEQYTAPGCSGHGSIRDTLAHLLNVQYGWLSWYDGSMEIPAAFTASAPKENFVTVESAHARWKVVDAQTRAFLGNLTEKQLTEEKSFTRSNGVTSSLPLWKLLLHTANHGTHTRGQIIAAVRRAEINPGWYDLIGYEMSKL